MNSKGDKVLSLLSQLVKLLNEPPKKVARRGTNVAAVIPIRKAKPKATKEYDARTHRGGVAAMIDALHIAVSECKDDDKVMVSEWWDVLARQNGRGHYIKRSTFNNYASKFNGKLWQNCGSDYYVNGFYKPL